MLMWWDLALFVVISVLLQSKYTIIFKIYEMPVSHIVMLSLFLYVFSIELLSEFWGQLIMKHLCDTE